VRAKLRGIESAGMLCSARELDHAHLARPLTAGVHLVQAFFLVYQPGGEQTLADELGMEMPEPMPKALARTPKPEVDASPSLSLFARPGDGSIRTRRIAIFVAHGVDGEAARGLFQRLAVRPAHGNALGRVGSFTLRLQGSRQHRGCGLGHGFELACQFVVAVHLRSEVGRVDEEGRVDLLGGGSSESLTDVLQGIDPALVDRVAGSDFRRSFRLTLQAQLPGEVQRSTSERAAAGLVSWTVEPGQAVDIRATTRRRNVLAILTAAGVGVLVVLVLLASAGVALAARRSARAR